MEGKRVGIVGLGSIGLEVAKRLEAFGCIILYNSRKEKPFVSYPFYSNVVELAANNDALVICCELNDQTCHMINKEVMLALGKKWVLINVRRGAIVDEKVMVWCLVQGEIAGAGLDVFENEPDVPKELFAMDNVVLSPHQASLTSESSKALCELLVSNLEAFFSLNNVVLSPHQASLTSESSKALCELLVANLEAFFSNKPLISPVMNDWMDSVCR